MALRSERWRLIRENIKFQIKLALDASRDILLSPVAITCAIIDLILGNGPENGYFKRLMNLSHQTDKWLNLFGHTEQKSSTEIKKAESGQTQQVDFSASKQHFTVKPTAHNVDDLLAKIETLIDEQQKNGNIPASAKQTLDGYLTRLFNSDSAIAGAKPSSNITDENKSKDN